MRPEDPRGEAHQGNLGESLAWRSPDLTESMALVLRHQEGDAAALGLLLERYQARLRRIVHIRLGGRLRRNLETMDIVQEANAVAMRKIGDLELRDHASILRWLSTIALNKIRDAHDFFTAERRDVDRVVALDGEWAAVARDRSGDTPSPHDAAERKELHEVLDDCMTELTPEYQEVILLRDYSGGSWEYVTQALGSPTIHAAQELHRRAWIRLRRLVRPRIEPRE